MFVCMYVCMYVSMYVCICLRMYGEIASNRDKCSRHFAFPDEGGSKRYGVVMMVVLVVVEG